MKTMMIVLGLAWGASPLLAQEEALSLVAEARQRADAARQKCAALLEGVDGISSVGMGGSGSDYRLIIVARDLAAKGAARTLLGGEQVQGVRILWSMQAPSTDSSRAPAPAPAPAPDKVPDVQLEPKVRSGSAAPSVVRPESSSNEGLHPGWWTRPWIVWVHTDRGWEVRRNHFYSPDGTCERKPYPH